MTDHFINLPVNAIRRLLRNDDGVIPLVRVETLTPDNTRTDRCSCKSVEDLRPVYKRVLGRYTEGFIRSEIRAGHEDYRRPAP